MAMKINPPKKANQPITHADEKHHDISEDKKTFIKKANQHSPIGEITNKESSQKYPWNDEWVRKDVIKLFNLRLSEPDFLKLKYIADQTDSSMHTVCLDIIIPAIQRKIKKLTEKV